MCWCPERCAQSRSPNWDCVTVQKFFDELPEREIRLALAEAMKATSPRRSSGHPPSVTPPSTSATRRTSFRKQPSGIDHTSLSPGQPPTGILTKPQRTRQKLPPAHDEQSPTTEMFLRGAHTTSPLDQPSGSRPANSSPIETRVALKRRSARKK